MSILILGDLIYRKNLEARLQLFHLAYVPLHPLVFGFEFSFHLPNDEP